MSENVLTSKQKKGLAALLTRPTITAAAAQAGVTEKTLYRWLGQPAFSAELKAKQVGIIDAAAGGLVAGLTQALDTLAELMTDGHGENVRRSAASEWLDQCLMIRENTDLERRLTELERQVKR